MKTVCEKVVYEELLASLMFLNVNFLSLCFIYFNVKKTYLRVRMGRILNLLLMFIGGEGKESSGACEQSRGEKSFSFFYQLFIGFHIL